MGNEEFDRVNRFTSHDMTLACGIGFVIGTMITVLAVVVITATSENKPQTKANTEFDDLEETANEYHNLTVVNMNTPWKELPVEHRQQYMEFMKKVFDRRLELVEKKWKGQTHNEVTQTINYLTKRIEGINAEIDRTLQPQGR